MAEQIYALERLYEDQAPDLVVDTIPAVLAWLSPSTERAEHTVPFAIRVETATYPSTKEATLTLAWNVAELRSRDLAKRTDIVEAHVSLWCAPASRCSSR